MNRIAKWIRRTEDGKRSVIRSYTAAFLLMCLVVFPWYYLAGRSFIWKSDGWKQHYKALVYYAQYIRSIWRSVLVDHSFTIPAYDFSISEGGSILETFHYYVIGDPFAFFAFLVPTSAMVFYYMAMILLRMYCAGLAFMYLIRYFRGKCADYSRIADIAGAIAYVFCYWGIFTAVRHPYFLNPMIYFPLLVVGIEKIIRRERPYLFIAMVGITALSNFYFFYLLGVLTAMYALVRVIYTRKKDVRAIVADMLRLGLAAIFGVALAAVIVLPMCRTFLMNSRMETNFDHRIFYPASYYLKLPAILMSAGDSYWICFGLTVPVFPAVCLLWKRKGNTFLKICMICCAVMMIFPVFGQILNGLSYMTNRWSWALALLCTITFVRMWPELMSLDVKTYKFLRRCALVYGVLCVVTVFSLTTRSFVSLGLLLYFLWLIRPDSGETQEKKLYSVISVMTAGIFLVSFFCNAFISDATAAKNIGVVNAVMAVEHSEATRLRRDVTKFDDSGWYRFSGNNLDENENVIGHTSSTSFYWSIGNPYTADFRKLMLMREYSLYDYVGYDDRTILTTLSGTKYYIETSDSGGEAPYGFRQIGLLTDTRKRLYVNEYALPGVYTYDTCILRDQWENVNSADKEASLLEAAVLETAPEEIPVVDPKQTSQSIPFTIRCGDGVSASGDVFVVTRLGAKITLNFDGIPNAETYVTVRGHAIKFSSGFVSDAMKKPFEEPIEVGPFVFEKPEDFQPLATDKIDWKVPYTCTLLVSSGDGEPKKAHLRTSNYPYYNGRDEFCINVGYSKQARNEITITFDATGTFKLSEIEIVCRSLDGYEESVAARKADPITNVSFANDTIRATVTTDGPRVVCFAIPYHEGFTAYINGQETELLPTNIGYMGVVVPAGTSAIRITYREPLLFVGGMISLLSGIAFALLIWVTEKRRKLHPAAETSKNEAASAPETPKTEETTENEQ